MRVIAYGLSALLMSSSLAMADMKVTTSIKPIHSLVASVMEGVGTPGLIVDGNNSPHTYNMKPSDAAMLEQSQVIFWVGHELEAFLEKPIEALGTKAVAVALLDEKSITTLQMREDANFAAHEHEEDKHDHGEKADGHGHGEEKHDHGEKAEGHEHGEEKHAHEEEKKHEHNHEGADGHIWLDPENAKAILKVVADTLSKADAPNAATYSANAEKTAAKIDKMSAEIKAILAPARGQGFLVFHDAYQYFEKRFDITASGALSINPENMPGAEAITKLKAQIADGKIKCVFSEPQFDDKLTKLLLEGSSVKSAVLDPEGAQLENGPGLYFELMKNMGASFSTCLSAA